jgi:hypothetical protein
MGFQSMVYYHTAPMRRDEEYINSIEIPRVNVTLASQISSEENQSLGLEYVDPREIVTFQWQNLENEELFSVPNAGET